MDDQEEDPRDLVLLTTGSIIDLPAALRDGHLELAEHDSDNVIPFHNIGEEVKEEQRDITPTSFIILPPHVKGKFEHKRTIPLHAASALRKAVRPGHTYRLRLGSKDLGIKWWNWGNTPEKVSNGTELPPNMPQRLVSSSSTSSRPFTVLSAVELAPKLSIALSLQPVANLVEKDRTETTDVKINITIQNCNDQPITRRTQHHLRKTGEISSDMRRVTDIDPEAGNFSVKDQVTQEELMGDAPVFVSYVGGGNGWSRREFLTLGPGEQAVRTARLSEQFLERNCTRGREYRVSLRSRECWWASGTLDRLFGEGNEVLKTWPAGLKIPMALESDHSLVFRY